MIIYYINTFVSVGKQNANSNSLGKMLFVVCTKPHILF